MTQSVRSRSEFGFCVGLEFHNSSLRADKKKNYALLNEKKTHPTCVKVKTGLGKTAVWNETKQRDERLVLNFTHIC